MSGKSLKQIYSVQDRREIQFMKALEEILIDHTEAGFVYPKIKIEGQELRLPVYVHFKCERDEHNLFGSRLIHFDGTKIVVDLWEIYDHPQLLDEFIDSPFAGHKVSQSTVDLTRDLVHNIRHLYRTPKKHQIRSMLSEALGSFLIATHIQEYPMSWLNAGCLGSRMAVAGVQRYFHYFYDKPSSFVSADVWDRFAADESARRAFWSSPDFLASAGHDLVRFILRDFRQRGLEQLVMVAPENGLASEAAHLPGYAKKIYEELSRSAYQS